MDAMKPIGLSQQNELVHRRKRRRHDELYNNPLQLSRELDDLQHRSALSLKAEDRRSNNDSTSGSISSVASPPGQELQQELDKRLAPTTNQHSHLTA